MQTKAKIVHRDLKPENILVDRNGRAFIGDIGEAKVMNTTTFKGTDQATIAGTQPWMAPEVILNYVKDPEDRTLFNKALPKTDIFSLGLITLYCLDLDEFRKYKHKNIDENVLKKYLDSFQDRKKLPEEIFDLLKKMVSFESSNRPSIEFLYDTVVEVCFDKILFRVIQGIFI